MDRKPRDILEHAEQLLVRGDLIGAQHYLEANPQKFSSEPEMGDELRVELAKVWLYQGESTRATEVLEQPLDFADKETLIKADLIVAMAQLRRGNAALADKALKNAADLNPTGALRGEILWVKGNIALDSENLEEAGGLFAAALKENIAAGASFSVVQVLLNQGVVALYQQHYTDALEIFQRTYDLAVTLGAGQSIEKAEGNIARVYYQTGDYKRARLNAEAAAKKAEVLGAKFDQIHWLTNAGLGAFALNEVTEAQSYFEKSLALALGIKNPSLALQAEVAISYVLLHKHPELAVAHIAEAERLAREGRNRSDDCEPVLLHALLAVQQGRILEAESRLASVIDQSNDSPSLRWEAQNTLADLYEKTNRPQLAEQWYQRAINTFRLQRLSLKSLELQLPFLENGSDLYMGYMEHLIRAGRTDQALLLLDTSRAETLAEGLGAEAKKQGKAVDPRAVAERLRSTVLVYCLRPERSYLWAVTGREQKFYILPGSGAVLPLVARHSEAILAAKDMLAQKDSTGRALYDALLAPAAELLPKDGGRMVLVADSALSRLNFETLIAPGNPAKGETPHYWIEDASVTNARSLRLLAAGSGPRRTNSTVKTDARKMLLIGDPVYTKGEYAPLPNAGAEMAEIAEHFALDERVIAARQEASPAAYGTSQPGRFRFLHFVAHATASELNPLDSAVILSGRGDSGSAGATNKLYASEILKQPLSAELVTVSSCYSSGTRNYAGEGVVGLAWAFLRAGAHSVIGALWEVSDVSTPKLMDTMYTRLLAGDAPDAALRAAKLEMLHSDGVFRKPVYWGAFQLYAGR